MPIAKINKLLPSPPRDFSAIPPTRVAPKVLAMVFKLKMAELVSSNSFRNFASKLPLRGEVILRFSSSAEVILKIIASRVEQRAEIPMVRDTATIKSKDIAY